MTTGKIRFAEGEGTFILKFMGDVRLTLCTTLDEFLDEMFSKPAITDIVIDLAETEGIDSTSLGLLAKLARQARQRYQLTPTIISTNNDITRVLESMGFDQVFRIEREIDACPYDYADLPYRECCEQSARSKVLDAHRVLMNLSDSNRQMFGPLVQSLETEAAGTAEPASSEEEEIESLPPASVKQG